MQDSTQSELIAKTVTGFHNQFGHKPVAIGLAPGRVEVLGNHTDYNGGYTLSAAIDKYSAVAISPSNDTAIKMSALDLGETAVSDMYSIQKQTDNIWANYFLGVIDELSKLPDPPKLGGVLLAIHSTVPFGSGLSSSAAMEVATALAVQSSFPYSIDKMPLAQLCQRAENLFVGVPCGLMDQFSSVFGQRDSLLFLDSFTREHEALKIGGDHKVKLVVCNSMVQHQLSGSEYSTRRTECMSAAKKMGHELLRDSSLEELETYKDRLTDYEYKRAKHVISDNARVLKAREAALVGNVKTLGKLMIQSHESSRDDFQNSTPELDKLVELAINIPGCYGSRLTGGGFGGSTLSLVDANYADEFSATLSDQYGQIIGNQPTVFVCQISDGAIGIEL